MSWSPLYAFLAWKLLTFVVFRKHTHPVVDLISQYRMNEDIMLLSNKLIYGDLLRCGSEEVAKRTLVVLNECMSGTLGPGMCLCEESCWLRYLLSESCKVVFVDTDHLPARDQELETSSKMMSKPSLCTRLQKRS
ncbi:hypothetical protein CY34DRAFT_784398 [Suillus luteus UH-Slu-Lm8-n1]|uniref:DNA2/NAM7 helicase-like C-terminal domain-containing protein n=1 Tax=Suillus luteus UH-Slu-Lm8-n1 TaxID=930992 RepID=A0A0D0ASL3_9AGAM|nr:hypothetical protein CY34DRAFT_784398 [Suillus luteus UH-Slu-Lm8-n1]